MSDDQRRADDVVIARLEQKFDDFVTATEKWQTNHDKTSIEWRETIDKRLEPVEEWVKGVNIGYKILIGIAGIGVTVLKLWEKIKHLKP